jgi:hypothetical protein
MLILFAFVRMNASAAGLSAVLTNRWSFNTPYNTFGSGTTVTDSVAGQVAVMEGDAYLDGTQLQLDGSAGSYLLLATNLGLISGLQSVSLEGWVDSLASPDNVHLFEFSDGAGTGNSYLRYVLHDSGNARNFFELADTTAGPNEFISDPVGFGGVQLHVVCVYDPVHGIQSIYTNGVLEATQSGVTTPLSGVATNASSLGRSPWWAYGDPYMAGTIQEFRIWNGALSPLDVVALDQAGSNTIPANTAVPTSITVSAPFSEIVGDTYQASVVGTVSGYAVSINITPAVTNFASGNTNVLTINSNGVITAHNQGSTTITATFGSLSATNTVTVSPAVAYLTNRWTFNQPNGSTMATDTVSGMVGTCLSSGTNYCYITNGTLLMGGGTSANPGWFSMPGGLVTGLQSVTFEGWITTNSPTPDNVGLFEFSTGAGTGGSYLRYVYHDNGNVRGTYEITSGSTVTVHATQPPIGGRTNAQHVAIIYDPNAQVMAVFTNGVLLTVRSGSLPALSNVPTNESGLGQSPWHNSGDPYFAGAISDFRIYSGTLTPQKVAMSYLEGPNASTTTLDTNDPGPLQSVSMTAPATMTAGSQASYGVLATYHNLANFDIVHNSYVTPVPGLTVTSGNTNVVSIPASGVLQANSAGTAVITTVYQGVTNNATVTVSYPPIYSLIHRYSFTADASDSIGGANGTFEGTAAITNGMAGMDGNATDYVSLPGGLISGLPATTLEIWYTCPAPLTTGGSVWSFASATSGSEYLRFVPRNAANSHLFEIVTGADGGGTESLTHAGQLDNNTWHVTCIYDPSGPKAVMSVYTNGVLDSIATNAIWPLSTVATNFSYIGESPWAGDPGFPGSVDEYRIYSGRLAPVDIATTQALGPNALLVSQPSLGAAINGGSVTLTWPLAASGFSLVSSPGITGIPVWTAVTNTPVTVGSNYQVTLPNSGTSKFFQLRR